MKTHLWWDNRYNFWLSIGLRVFFHNAISTAVLRVGPVATSYSNSEIKRVALSTIRMGESDRFISVTYPPQEATLEKLWVLDPDKSSLLRFLQPAASGSGTLHGEGTWITVNSWPLNKMVTWSIFNSILVVARNEMYEASMDRFHKMHWRRMRLFKILLYSQKLDTALKQWRVRRIQKKQDV